MVECPKCTGDDTFLISISRQEYSTIKGYKCRECGNSWEIQYGSKDDPKYVSEPLNQGDWL
jgi:transposase-like protein